MVFSVLFLGALHAAEPTVVWTPGVPNLGHQGLVSGEFDGHEGVDWAASYHSEASSGLVVHLSGTESDWVLSTPELTQEIRLRTGNWDGDPELEILVGLPNHGLGGAAGILDLSEAQELPEGLQEASTYWVESAESEAHFGADLTVLDCVEGGQPELIVSAPFSRMNGTVYSYSAESSESPKGEWTVKWESSHRFGYALEVVDSPASGLELMVASCEVNPDTEEACVSDGKLWRVSGEACEGIVSLNATDAEVGGLQGVPTVLRALVGESTVMWSAPLIKTVLEGDPLGALGQLETFGDEGDFLQTQEKEGVQSWFSSSGRVWKIGGSLQGVEVESPSHRSFELEGQEALGLRLADAGDWDSDGCPDVLSSSLAGDSLWLLSGCEASPEDTGLSGDTGSSQEDTGDAEEPPCESEFGWQCAAVSPAWRPGVWSVLLGLFCLNRRRKID